MDYLELALAVRPGAVEAAADLLRRHAPAGVSIEAPFTATDHDGGVAIDPGAPVALRAWLPADGGAERAALAPLRAELRALGDDLVHALRVRAVRDASWADGWKRHFRVLRVGRHIVLKPSWRRHRARADDIVIELDPGQAFGTGQHATTRLCLEALEERLRPGARVLDLGTGSGVLAVAAAKLGAARVDAVDTDPVAVRAAGENARRNRVGGAVRAALGSLGDSWPFGVPAADRYDLLLANLSARTVEDVARPIMAALRADGVALISGVIEEQAANCERALVAAGGRVVERRGAEGWLLLAVAPTGRSPRTSRAPGRPRRRAR